MTQIAALPTKSARKPQIRPPLAEAIRLIVHEGLTIPEAAQRVSYARESLSKALTKPHVLALVAAVKRAWMDSETSKAWLTVATLASTAASEDVRLKAAKVILEAAGELNPRGDSNSAPRSLVQIIVNGSAGPPEMRETLPGVFEVSQSARRMVDTNGVVAAE